MDGQDLIFSFLSTLISGTSGGGYPDFIQNPNNGDIFITQTQKSIARISQIDPVLLEDLFRQDLSNELITDGIFLFLWPRAAP